MHPAPLASPLSKIPHLDFVALNARLWDAGRGDLQRRLSAVYRDQVIDKALPADIAATLHPPPRHGSSSRRRDHPFPQP